MPPTHTVAVNRLTTNRSLDAVMAHHATSSSVVGMLLISSPASQAIPPWRDIDLLFVFDPLPGPLRFITTWIDGRLTEIFCTTRQARKRIAVDDAWRMLGDTVAQMKRDAIVSRRIPFSSCDHGSTLACPSRPGGVNPIFNVPVEFMKGAPMSTQAQELAAQFDAVNSEVIAAIDGCSESDWRATCADEQWSVAVVAHHIGEVQGNFLGFITGVTSAAAHQASLSQDDVDRMNVMHARQYANVGKAETLALVTTNGSALSALVAGLDDDQLARVAGVFVGTELTVQQLMEMAVIVHFQEHLKSMTATISV